MKYVKIAVGLIILAQFPVAIGVIIAQLLGGGQ
jgi:hypothetical protein